MLVSQKIFLLSRQKCTASVTISLRQGFCYSAIGKEGESLIPQSCQVKFLWYHQSQSRCFLVSSPLCVKNFYAPCDRLSLSSKQMIFPRTDEARNGGESCLCRSVAAAAAAETICRPISFSHSLPYLHFRLYAGNGTMFLFGQNSATVSIGTTGFLSEIGTKLRDQAVGQAGGSCYSWAALSSNDSKTLYTVREVE